MILLKETKCTVFNNFFICNVYYLKSLSSYELTLTHLTDVFCSSVMNRRLLCVSIEY